MRTKIVVDIETGSQRSIPMTAEEIAAIEDAAQKLPSQRIDEIKERLAQIDIDSVRPLRAIAAGSHTQFDSDKLASLDSEAAALRAELASL